MDSEELKNIRINQGLSQTGFATKLGVSLRTVQNWESGSAIPRSKEILIRNIFVTKNAQDDSGYKSKNNIGAHFDYSNPEYIEKDGVKIYWQEVLLWATTNLKELKKEEDGFYDLLLRYDTSIEVRKQLEEAGFKTTVVKKEESK